MNKTKWDRRFLQLAKLISTWSKDPSTQCGAVITRDKQIISQGYNGFPKGVNDTPYRLGDRKLKYSLILHAEVNAILYCGDRDLNGCTIYTYPMPPCIRCCSQIIQSGIKRVVTVSPDESKLDRWEDDFKLAEELYVEANVEYIEYKKRKEWFIE